MVQRNVEKERQSNFQGYQDSLENKKIISKPQQTFRIALYHVFTKKANKTGMIINGDKRMQTCDGILSR